MSEDDAFERLKAAVLDSPERSRNEADTRQRLINLLLYEILAWPENRVSLEEYIRPGYADYILKRRNSEPIILVEAKKEGIFFTLPKPTKADVTYSYIDIQKLMSDESIRDTIIQVRAYCIDIGCEYAAITNGHEWIFFKTFEKSRRWDSLRAFVIRGLEFFLRENTRAINTLAYRSIVDRASLAELLTSSPPKDRAIFYPRDRINSFSHTVQANRLAPVLRPVVTKYFGVIDDDDPEFMKRCYVSQRDDRDTLRGVRALLQDTLTPYFKEFGVKQLHDTDEGGQIGQRITQFVKRTRHGQVLVLFGGKGAGKSTFIRRLLHHQTPKWLKDHSIIVILDLLSVPEDLEAIRSYIWETLVHKLDQAGVLQSDRENLISELFGEQYQIALKQDLAGLAPQSEAFNLKLNELVSLWKNDSAACALRLVKNWQLAGRGCVVVLDNTDQYTGPVQDFCFTSAQEIAKQLGCTALISMREERFYNSKMHGVLDAFQNSGFHISSPQPAEVFRKRVDFAVDIFQTDSSDGKDDDDQRSPDLAESIQYLKVVKRELSKRHSHLTNFLTACAHGDTRLSLDLFRSFLLSGYTNVDEILSAQRWDFQIHQVLKPVMVPSRFFYDETLSDIPNIFQLRHTRHCSHFTAMRILRKLAKSMEGGTAGYVPLTQLYTHFAEVFNMADDMKENLDVLLKRGFVEARNRLDAYSDDLDDLKITPYGIYMLNELAYYFTYLDLVCVDCGIFDEGVSNFLSEAASQEYQYFLSREPIKRIELRLGRAERFIEYLNAEELREREAFNLTMPEEEMFTFKAKSVFTDEKERVLHSALRRKK